MSYEVSPQEQGSIHVILKYKDFDQKTGKRTVPEYVQKFSEAEFRTFEKNAENLGYELEILHDPRKKKPNVLEEQEKVELEKARGEYESVFNKKPHAQKSAETLREEIAEAHDYDNVLKKWQEVMKVKTKPSISKDDMLQDIRDVMKKQTPVQKEHDDHKEEAIKNEENRVKEHAEGQKS